MANVKFTNLDKAEFLDQGHATGYYRYAQWLCAAWRRAGGAICRNICMPRKLRAVFGRTLNFNLCRIGKPLIVCGSHRIESMAWPYNMFREIIPIMWDLWPGNYADFAKFVYRNKVRLVFCSSSMSVAAMSKMCPFTKFVWLPEAVDPSSYSSIGKLKERTIDVLSYGRSAGDKEREVQEVCKNKGYSFKRGAGSTFEELVSALNSSRISLCFPLCDTNPDKAQGVETLTIRYWEAMVSGTLMVGRAPKELIDVCGYNPMAGEMSRQGTQVAKILDSIDEYQYLADRNIQTAKTKGCWDSRIPLICKGLDYGD